jgi:hypothetical protein
VGGKKDKQNKTVFPCAVTDEKLLKSYRLATRRDTPDAMEPSSAFFSLSQHSRFALLSTAFTHAPQLSRETGNVT